MPSERVQRQLDRLLDEAEQAFARQEWSKLEHLAKQALALDQESVDAQAFAKAASEMLGGASSTKTDELPASESLPAQAAPSSFAGGRYQVKKFLGEGGKKKVYLAHDSTLDRDVAFALIKAEGLDDVGRDRISREAQAMGRLGAHPHIVTVFDLGEENGQPFMVTELMGGGDVEGVIAKAPEHRLPLDQALSIAEQVCQGLEFAHGQSIVHRDLKPGNVWLTADGVAKIGDFGLAVAIDKTRLTQAGMMVGTVNYMPPEQATGGEVTSCSDLYSLGAMLYEMVTGRPPFVGDEAVAIIGQHLNTPPVAPSWHRPDCQPTLEALILRLLEKDPNKRPASAKEVRESIKAIQLAAHPAEEHGPPVASTASDNPMYRRTFVGRETELKQLHAAFDAAMSGQGSLATVVGEPGIGKTAACERVPLRGLTAEEVQRMMASVSQQEIPWAMAELVHRQTEGNPLFVQEMLRYLVEEGLVERRDGALRRVGEETLAGRIPEGLRDVIGKRLSRLTPGTNQVLSVAAVIGRDFRLDVLERVAGQGEEEVEQALERATAAAVVEQRQATGTVGFRFTHAFFRQTLYEEIFVPRRIRLHQQVARALVTVYGRRVDEHAAELAEHFAQTTDTDDLEQALHYARVAAERAMAVYAYGEADRHLEQALKVQEVLDPDDAAMRCDLLLALGEALLAAGGAGRILDEIAPEAFRLAERLADSNRASQASRLAIRATSVLVPVLYRSRPDQKLWSDRADSYAAPESVERAQADIALAQGCIAQGALKDAPPLLRRAHELAKRLNDAQTLCGRNLPNALGRTI
jgi:hypothetical protein